MKEHFTLLINPEPLISGLNIEDSFGQHHMAVLPIYHTVGREARLPPSLDRVLCRIISMPS